MALAADTPAWAPWLELVEAQVRRAAEELGIAPVEIPSAPEEKEIAPPSEEALEAAAAMSENARAAFITSMVYRLAERSEEHTSELQSPMSISYAVFCLKKNISISQTKYLSKMTKIQTIIHSSNNHQ